MIAQAANDAVEILDPWVAEAPPVSKVHAGYMKVVNNSNKLVHVSHASSDQYGSVEVHLSSEKDGVASMRRVEAVAVPAGEAVSFKPGGYHLMLMRPKQKLVAGDRVKIRLSLDDGRSFELDAEVRKHQGDTSHHHHHHH